MINHIRHIGITLLVLIFVASTAGLSFTYHHCQLSGHKTVHFISNSGSCTENTCCSHDKPLNSYCYSFDDNEIRIEKKHNTCCKHTAATIKIKSEYILEHHHFQYTPVELNLFLSLFASQVLKKSNRKISYFSIPSVFGEYDILQCNCCFLL